MNSQENPREKYYDSVLREIARQLEEIDSVREQIKPLLSGAFEEELISAVDHYRDGIDSVLAKLPNQSNRFLLHALLKDDVLPIDDGMTLDADLLK